MMHMNEIYISDREVYSFREPGPRVLRRSPLTFMTRNSQRLDALDKLDELALLPHRARNISSCDQLYRVT
jgi:hypothetical protein